MPVLYVIATPIGNLEDLSRRAVRVLESAPLVATEQLAAGRRLLSHLGIRRKPLVTYNEHNRRQRIPQIIEALGEGDVALVSVAGTPAVSDPGAELVAAAREAGFAVVPVPGPSAAVAALSASGFAAQTFAFLGFLPHARRDAAALLDEAAGFSGVLVLYEAPHRLHRTLALLREHLGDRRCVIARELTKLHEEIWAGTLAGAPVHFAEPRGEFTIVVDGIPPGRRAPADPELTAAAEALVRSSPSARDAVRQLRELGISRREAFGLWLRAREKRG